MSILWWTSFSSRFLVNKILWNFRMRVKSCRSFTLLISQLTAKTASHNYNNIKWDELAWVRHSSTWEEYLDKFKCLEARCREKRWKSLGSNLRHQIAKPISDSVVCLFMWYWSWRALRNGDQDSIEAISACHVALSNLAGLQFFQCYHKGPKKNVFKGQTFLLVHENRQETRIRPRQERRSWLMAPSHFMHFIPLPVTHSHHTLFPGLSTCTLAAPLIPCHWLHVCLLKRLHLFCPRVTFPPTLTVSPISPILYLNPYPTQSRHFIDSWRWCTTKRSVQILVFCLFISSIGS